MKLYSFTAHNRKPHELFAPLAQQPYSLLFDSADTEHELSRYSFIAFHPLETIESKNGKITVTNNQNQLSFDGQPFDIVKERLELYGLDRESNDNLPPFQGGAAGFFGYDLARSLENLPEETEDNPSMPDMAVGIYDQVFAYDHREKKGWFMVHAANEHEAKTRQLHFLKLTSASSLAGESNVEEWASSHTRDQYEQAVQRVIDYIYAGDVFQANMSQRFEAALPHNFNPYAHYMTLREINAAPFSTFMNFGSVKLASASPERFLFVKDRAVETRPIKGTQKRSLEEAVDQFYRNQLENSEKDRAENVMIVDLLRNDLSKTCEDHSIEVPQLCKLESFAKVHHLVSTIKGTLRADQSPVDLLQSCFPGGSITGTPKVRAMEIIEELEQKRRGPYCGSMGYIGFDGTMDTNVAIRTLVYDGASVSFNVGGGIVADSKPGDEYDETLTKAEAIFKSFDITELTKKKTG